MSKKCDNFNFPKRQKVRENPNSSNSFVNHSIWRIFILGQMLNAREPKIVNGPEVLDKYVGESEAKIRALFAEAEAEERSMGPLSGLHIIIFDEIDAICKARGSLAGSSGVNDTVVNQLLSKIDGVEQLNNILVIGMTNRKDMIDEALMRPGRLEVQIGKILDDP